MRVYKLAAVTACRASRNGGASSRMFVCIPGDMRSLSRAIPRSWIADIVGELGVCSRRVLEWHPHNNGTVALLLSRETTSRGGMLLSLRFRMILVPKSVFPNSHLCVKTIALELGPFAAPL